MVTVSGAVLNSATDEPVLTAIVHFRLPSAPALDVASSRMWPEGYSVAVEAGDYSVLAEAPGYEPNIQDVSITDNVTLTMELTPLTVQVEKDPTAKWVAGGLGGVLALTLLVKVLRRG